MSVVKFKNYGVDVIEVGDDGSGISPHDYDSIGVLAGKLLLM
jgi:DNA mismatch repair ATPase MutL